ncbi:MAG: OsmC family protein [Gemmatimonadetes bacterium]|nr:OsmC family protein [Gemmatimonadota bacterium]
MTADPKRSVRLDWAGEGLRFRGGGTYPVTPTIEIDGDNGSAPGPMLVLLLAAAGCTAADVVLILEKTRVELSALSVEVDGTRREQDPRRYEAVHFRYRIRGKGLDDAKATRAVSLSVEKYCSVMHTLAPDVEITYDVEVSS